MHENNENLPNYSGPDRQLEARLSDLLGRMTLTEKVGQMVQLDLSAPYELEQMIRHGRIGSVLALTDLREINRLQRIAVEESRLGCSLFDLHPLSSPQWSVGA